MVKAELISASNALDMLAKVIGGGGAMAMEKPRVVALLPFSSTAFKERPDTVPIWSGMPAMRPVLGERVAQSGKEPVARDHDTAPMAFDVVGCREKG